MPEFLAVPPRFRLYFRSTQAAEWRGPSAACRLELGERARVGAGRHRPPGHPGLV